MDVVQFLTKDFWNRSAVRIPTAQDKELVQSKQLPWNRVNNLTICQRPLSKYVGLNQREIGSMMGIDYSSVSVGRMRFQNLIRKNKTLLRRSERVNERLSQK
jgi:hypothetical protein